ncbi:sensor histidine kinase [Rhizobium paknamense]|uniref:histidine kinase n=1 Tax=Rhizobium paknamense TaxID=1206817 RepID=A0ABU0IE92_9HYPH|nr:sensor histidine kinase [Rhizobium paknamense]MDQ0455963.1 two-component system sensor histidine kinase TctE [Rhizobium paknamense]
MLRFGAIVLCGAALLVTAAWFYAREAADDAYDRILVGAALQMTENLVVNDGVLNFDLPASAFELLGLAGRDRIFYRVIDSNGATLTGYNDLNGKVSLESTHLEPQLSNGTYQGVDIRIVTTARAITDAAGSGWAYVVLAQTTEARQDLVSELTARALFLVAIMSGLALMGAAIAVRYALKPVATVGEALKRREPQDLTPLSVSVPRELSPFVTSINHFIQRLDQRVKLLQRYVADSAHQLRTPLTALSAQLSLIDETRLPQEDRRHLERMRDRAAELARFTNQLLNHAMVIHRFDSTQLTPVIVQDVARQAFRVAVPITIDPDIVVSYAADDEELVIQGDALSLREAIVNIIDNAIRHGVKARLDVRVLQLGAQAVIEVEDDGPGIAPEQWPHVTQRFVSSRTDGESSGLGFAIAAEVATALGGELGFREAGKNHGFIVFIALPLAQGIKA